MHATPWSLDEFVAHDVFMVSDPAASAEPTPEQAVSAIDLTAIEQEFERRLEAERARIEAEAYARGRAEGEQAARAMLDEAITSALSTLDTAVQSVQAHEARWVGNAEENIAALSVIVAEHLVQREIATDPELVSVLVSNALAQYPVDQEITIRLSPDDLSTCRRVIESEAAGRHLRWIADTSIGRGGCLTEGRERIIDGRVDTALERAYRSLAGVQAS